MDRVSRRMLGVVSVAAAVAALVAFAGRHHAATLSHLVSPHLRATFLSWRGDIRVFRDVEYVRTPGLTGRMDLYLPRARSRPLPVLILFHGGGWIEGSRSEMAVLATRFATLGYAVVNVDYRLAAQAPAPAAVEDARCAVRWVASNYQRYGLDPDRVTTAGGSAGGHLALMAGLATPLDGFDQNCDRQSDARVATVINLYGPTDLIALRRVPAARGFTDLWLSGDTSRTTLVRLSPLNHVHARAPAVLTLQGAADEVVPAEQATRLHAALEAAGVSNELHLIPGFGHDFSAAMQDSLLSLARRALLVKRAGGAAP